MGANATGKTSFGQMLMSVFNFIHKKETAYLINRICDVKKEANFSIDFVMNRFTLYSMQIIIHPVNDDDYTENNIEVKIDKIKIIVMKVARSVWKAKITFQNTQQIM